MNATKLRDLQIAVATMTAEALKDEFDFLVQMRETFDQRLQEVRKQLKALRIHTSLPAGRVAPNSHPGNTLATRNRLIAAFNGHDTMTVKELAVSGVRDSYLSYACKKGIVKRVRQGVYQLRKR